MGDCDEEQVEKEEDEKGTCGLALVRPRRLREHGRGSLLHCIINLVCSLRRNNED